MRHVINLFVLLFLVIACSSLKIADNERSLAELNAQFTQDLLASNRLLNELDETTDEKARERLKAEISKLETSYNNLCAQYNEQIAKLSELPIDLPNSCMILVH